MRSGTLPLITALVLIVPLTSHAQGQPGKVIFEAWDAAYLQGQNLPAPIPAGYSVTKVQEMDFNGKKYLQSSIQLRLVVKRFDTVINIDMDTGNLETPNTGKVASVIMKQYLGKDQTNTIAGVVDGKLLHLTQNDKNKLDPAPWDDSAVGIFRQRLLYQDKAVKKGDEFSFNSFEPTINLVVTQKVKAIGEEEVELFAGKFKKKALRLELKPEKVQGVQFPTQLLWLDETLMPIRSEAELPFGKLILYKATKEIAMGQVQPSVDIGINQYVMLKQRIANPYQVGKATYRIKFKEEEDLGTILVQDVRQQIKKLDANTLEVVVQATPIDDPLKKGLEEFLQNSYFIACDDVKVKELAKKAVGEEKDPLKMAQKMERYVKSIMKVANHEALATADHVAQTLQGDCTEFAMLFAAMCRAQGIPSRTAVGLIYADLKQGPAFAFHMWTEVHIKGQWLPLDATLGQGFVGATHIKIADQSWHAERTMTPLLPVFRVLGKIAIDVVQTSGGPSGLPR